MNVLTLQIDYPKDSEMMEVFECQETQSNRYPDTCMVPPSLPSPILTLPLIHLPHPPPTPNVWCLLFASRYKLSLLKCTTKALNQSVKISIRVDNRGFLSLQYMILTEDKQVCFVEYMVSRVCFVKYMVSRVDGWNCYQSVK